MASMTPLAPASLNPTIAPMPTQSTFASRGTGICILSLDAGGSRGLSQLKILIEIMHRLNFESKYDQPSRACDIFDMIGGVGSGGLIAILLVLFGMTTEAALAEFVDFSVNVLDKQEIDAQSRTTALGDYIENLLEKHAIDPNADLISLNQRSNGCKLAIPISYKVNVETTCTLRNYPARQYMAPNLTITEALMATLATPPLFISSPILKDATLFEYIGADWTLTNPTQEIFSEAQSAFGAEATVACILSLGCGHAGIFSSPDNGSGDWNQFLERLTKDGERTAQSIESQLGSSGLYYRLNVTSGLERAVDLAPGDVITHTVAYLADTLVSRRVDTCIDLLRMRDGVLSLEQINHPNSQSTLSPHLPPLTKSFVMRKEPWEFLKKIILDPRNNEDDGPRMLVVTGMGGCGKTQLVLKFLKVYESEFACRLFVDGSSKERIRADIIRNVRAMGKEHSQKGFEECLHFLSQPPPSGLRALLYDNVDDPDLDLSSLLPQGDSCAIAITSRNRILGDLYPESHLQLDTMSMGEAVELILFNSNPSGESTDQTQKDAVAIAQELGCLPIALQQARSYMQQTKCSAGTYLKRLSSNRHKLLSQATKYQLDTRSISTYAAFETSFGRLAIHVQRFLRILSYFHWRNFPLELVVLAAEHQFSDYERTYIGLDDKLHITTTILTDIFLHGEEWDATSLDQMTLSLQSYSLATIVPGVDTTLLQIHPLVHEWVRSCIPEEEKDGYQLAAVLLLALGARDDPTASMQYVASHVMHMSPIWETLHVNNAVAFGYILQNSGVFQGAIRLREMVVRELRGCLDPREIRLSDSLWDVAASYANSGRLKEAEVLQTEVLALRKEISGERHYDTISASNNLALTYRELGRFSEAEVLQVEVLKMWKETKGEQAPDVAIALNNLALTLRDLGRLREAEVLQEEARILRKQTLGERHPDTISAMNNLALTYRDLGRPEQAMLLQTEVLGLTKHILGEWHPATLRASSNLALTYRDLGRLEEAQTLQTQVLQRRHEAFGERHLDTIVVSSDLTTVLRRMKKLNEAEALAKEVVKLRVEILGEHHPETLFASRRLARIYLDQGRIEDAESTHVETLGSMRQILGDQHYRTTAAMLLMARIHLFRRRKSDAVELLATVEIIVPEILGVAHPQYVECQKLVAEAQKLNVASNPGGPPHDDTSRNIEQSINVSKPQVKLPWYSKFTLKKNFPTARKVYNP